MKEALTSEQVSPCDHYYHTDGTCLRCGALETAVDDKARGIYEKFTVTRNDGKSAHGEKHDGCQYFVLDIGCDPHAIPALLAYAESCKAEYPLLARDVRAKAQMACEHRWTDTLHGPDTVGEHCEICSVVGEDDDYEY